MACFMAGDCTHSATRLADFHSTLSSRTPLGGVASTWARGRELGAGLGTCVDVLSACWLGSWVARPCWPTGPGFSAEVGAATVGVAGTTDSPCAWARPAPGVHTRPAPTSPVTTGSARRDVRRGRGVAAASGVDICGVSFSPGHAADWSPTRPGQLVAGSVSSSWIELSGAASDHWRPAARGFPSHGNPGPAPGARKSAAYAGAGAPHVNVRAGPRPRG